MFPQISIIHNIGNVIEIPNQLNPNTFTYLSNNFAAGVTSLTVDNAADFNPGSTIILLGSMGAENCEFAYPSATTVTVITTAATIQPHNRGDLVSQINYDQVQIWKSTTIGGTYSLLATLTLFVTQQKTVYFDPAGLTTDFYYVAWKNSVSHAVSANSDPISVISYPVDSVGGLIFPVLMAMGVSENDPKITVPFCISAINDARKFVKASQFGIRHAWLQNFEFPIQVLAGSNFVYLPDDIDFDETDRSLLAGRFIINNVLAPFNLKYIDKRSWNQVAFNVGGSTTVGETEIGATTLQLVSSGDFPPVNNSGVGYIQTTAFNQTLLQFQYTSVDLATGELLGVTGIDRVIPDGSQVWVTPTIAQPIWYTVYTEGDEQDLRGKIVFDRIIPDSMQGNNFYIDYYKQFIEVSNLYQRLPEPYREIYKWYLRYAIKYRKDITTSQTDPDYVKFGELVQALFDNLYTGQDTTVVTG